MLDELKVITNTYVQQLQNDFEECITGWSIDLSREHVHAVIGGLLSRQCILSSELAINNNLWTPIAGPFFIRAMTELNINFGWIILDPDARCEEFVLYGLGQDKLRLEHLRKLKSLSLETGKRVRAQELWLNSQRHEMFTDVNVSDWAGKKTEEMAKEAGLDSTYLSYISLTGGVHGTWDHCLQLYLDSYGADARPTIPRVSKAYSYLFRGAVEVQLTFTKFRQFVGKPAEDTTYRTLIEKVNSLVDGTEHD